MRFLFLILTLLYLSMSAFPQAAKDSIIGIVIDPNGAAIPGAKVTATLQSKIGRKMPTAYETKTDDGGNFEFSNLPSGRYVLRTTSTYFNGSEAETSVVVPRNKPAESRIQLALGLGCGRFAEPRGIVTEADKAEIVRTALIEAIGSYSPLGVQRQGGQGVIVSVRNIKPEWLRGVSQVNFELMTQIEIQQRADIGGDFEYVSIPELTVRGQCVAIEVANTWAVGKHSGKAYVSGGGARYEFRKESGKWIMKHIGTWVS